MFERNWGRVVFLSSESGLNIPADMIHYGLIDREISQPPFTWLERVSRKQR